jgi:hypothetical protein
MSVRQWLGIAALACALAAPAVAATVAEIMERNAAARGGVEGWHKLQTLAWAGHVESAVSPQRNLPFLLEQKRPDRTRFEVGTGAQRSLRVYDGAKGWKVRATPTGQPEMKPYSEEELRFARGAQVIDGPLMDYVAKGALVSLAGMGEIDGRKAYMLAVQVPSGGDHRLWIDAETYLEARHDRQVGSTLGKPVRSPVFYREYRTFEGLQMPTTIETVEASGKAKNRLVIEKVALNPGFDDRMFAKPEMVVVRHNGVTVDTRSAADPRTR